MHKVGVIGAGVMGRRMVRGLMEHSGFVAPLIWDIQAEASEKIAVEFSEVEIAADVDSLVAAVDAVYISTPPSTHLAYCEQVLAAKKPIFCEKPLAVDIEAAEKLVAAVDAVGLPTGMNFPFSTMPSVQTISQMLTEGELGDPIRLEMRFHFTMWPRGWQQNAAAWLAKREEGGFVREVVSQLARRQLRCSCRLVGQTFL